MLLPVSSLPAILGGGNRVRIHKETRSISVILSLSNKQFCVRTYRNFSEAISFITRLTNRGTIERFSVPLYTLHTPLMASITNPKEKFSNEKNNQNEFVRLISSICEFFLPVDLSPFYRCIESACYKTGRLNKLWKLGGKIHAPIREKLRFLYEYDLHEQIGKYWKNENLRDPKFDDVYRKRIDRERTHAHLKSLFKFDVRPLCMSIHGYFSSRDPDILRVIPSDEWKPE